MVTRADTESSEPVAVSIGEPAPRRVISQKLGEELPIFCERCGYSLNGLPQGRCADCKILHFHCPECGHRQPINTLRPAVQRILGRLRALWLCIAVFFKFNFFGWLLVAWVAMGGEWSYRWEYHGNRTAVLAGARGPIRAMSQYTARPRELDMEGLMAFGCLGLGFGLVGRMLLLRWRRGYLVGLVLAGLVLAAVLGGAKFRQLDLSSKFTPYTRDFFSMVLVGASMVVIGAWIVWPIWMVLVRTFLPAKTAGVLLEWQRAMSNSVGKLGQE